MTRPCVLRRVRHNRFISVLAFFVAILPSATIVANTADAEAHWISAISHDDSDYLQFVLSRTDGTNEATPDRIWEVTAGNGKSALMVASKTGNGDLARQLVALGADVNARTKTDGTALMFAVLGDQQPLAAWLLALGSDINAQGSNGWTSVMIASAKGLDSTLGWLLDEEADANVPDVYGFSPLMRAVDNGHATAVTILLDVADVDVQWQDELANTALHYAVSRADAGIVQQLLQAGAPSTVKNRNGLTPMDLAEQAVIEAIDKANPRQAPPNQPATVLALLKRSRVSND